MPVFQSKSIFQFASKSDIIKIILTITITFVILQFIRITMLLSQNTDAPYYTYLWNPLCLPADLKEYVRQPWSLITYFFVDAHLMNIVGNMIWLWIFGTVIEDLKGPNRVWPVFITGSLLGGLFALVYAVINPVPGLLLHGSSAGIMGVAFAAITFKPNYRFWWFLGMGIPIWVFLLLFIGLRLASIQLNNLPQLFLLIGGMVSGLLYTKGLAAYYDRFSDLLHRSADWLSNANFVKERPATKRQYTQHQVPFRRLHNLPNKIDEILDKINDRGIQSLTQEERQILDDYSRSKRDH